MGRGCAGPREARLMGAGAGDPLLPAVTVAAPQGLGGCGISRSLPASRAAGRAIEGRAHSSGFGVRSSLS